MNCPKCKREIEPGEVTWPGDEPCPPEICQDCWEQACSELFWEQMRQDWLEENYERGG